MDTLVLSDLHLSDAEPEDPARPLWKGYKWQRFFVDDDVMKLLDHAQAAGPAPLELVLNGDIFDFDNITRLPRGHTSAINWLARLRGLASEEWMSLFKMGCIIDDHRPLFKRLGQFVRDGNRLIIVFGNHDAELHWPRVQRRILQAMGHASVNLHDDRAPIVFCEWFYISERDTLITHGHHFDPNCSVRSTIDPLILVHGRPRVRLPFGDLAERYMLNGMGYFNPHATRNFIMSGVEYVRFFFKYMLRGQPLLIWTWFWGALVTFVVAMWEHWRPPMRDPLRIDEKVAAIARKAQATPSQVRKLHALTVPSACVNPFRILRELWLDRGLLFLGVLYVAWQVVLLINFVWPISPVWVLLPLALLLPPFFIYAATVSPTVFTQPLLTVERAELIHKITGVRQVVLGHTHVAERCTVGPIHCVNGGFWSPAFTDPTCTQRVGTQTYVWIRGEGEPGGKGVERNLELWEWPPHAQAPAPFDAPCAVIADDE